MDRTLDEAQDCSRMPRPNELRCLGCFGSHVLCSDDVPAGATMEAGMRGPGVVREDGVRVDGVLVSAMCGVIRSPAYGSDAQGASSSATYWGGNWRSAASALWRKCHAAAGMSSMTGGHVCRVGTHWVALTWVGVLLVVAAATASCPGLRCGGVQRQCSGCTSRRARFMAEWEVRLRSWVGNPDVPHVLLLKM